MLIGDPAVSGAGYHPDRKDPEHGDPTSDRLLAESSRERRQAFRDRRPPHRGVPPRFPVVAVGTVARTWVPPSRRLSGRGTVICPWHGWVFDLNTAFRSSTRMHVSGLPGLGGRERSLPRDRFGRSRARACEADCAAGLTARGTERAGASRGNAGLPLPETVFFPGNDAAPSRVRTRYRQLVEDVLRFGRWIAVSLLKPGFEADYEGSPGFHEIAAPASSSVRTDSRRPIPDRAGRRARVRLSEVPSERMYRMVRAVPARKIRPGFSATTVLPPSGRSTSWLRSSASSRARARECRRSRPESRVPQSARVRGSAEPP